MLIVEGRFKTLKKLEETSDFIWGPTFVHLHIGMSEQKYKYKLGSILVFCTKISAKISLHPNYFRL
jgi:hypothetical protein